MRKLLLLLLSFIAITGCKPTETARQEKRAQGLEFEYSALTRGSYKKVTITLNGIATVKEINGKADMKPISTEDWNWLVSFYEDNIAGKIRLQDLEVPSKKHQYDGALAAVFTVKVADQIYNTPTFDHGAPPVKVAEIVNKMLSLSGLDKETK